MPKASNKPIPPPQAPPAAVFYRAENYRPEDSIGYLMRIVLSGLAHEIERQLEPSDLTNAQWLPLLKLHMGDGGTVAELARGCRLDAGAMTRLLDRLEAKGLCRRVRSVADRRVVNIELTDEGRAAAVGIPALLSGVQNACLDGFSAEEFETLKGFLRRMVANAPSKSPATSLSPLIPGGPNEA
jgi:DNA-binding MarR family transcriptional regulator